MSHEHTTDQLISSCLVKVRRLAWSIGTKSPPCIAVEDLICVGHLAVAECAHRFDPSFGVPFAAFSWPRARWAMLDHLRRELDWSERRKSYVEFEHPAAPLGDENPSDQLLVLAQLKERIAILPRRQRAVLGALLDGTPTKRFAHNHDVSYKTACRWKRKAISSLQALMLPAGGASGFTSQPDWRTHDVI